MDSKSNGLCPQGFKSPRCRFAWFRRHTHVTCVHNVPKLLAHDGSRSCCRQHTAASMCPADNFSISYSTAHPATGRRPMHNIAITVLPTTTRGTRKGTVRQSISYQASSKNNNFVQSLLSGMSAEDATRHQDGRQSGGKQIQSTAVQQINDCSDRAMPCGLQQGYLLCLCTSTCFHSSVG